MFQKIYRYLPQKYNNMLLNMGIIRIGTLYDFKDIEHKQGISDPTEGTKYLHHHIKHISGNSSADIRQKHISDIVGLKYLGIDIGSNIGEISLDNVKVSRKINSPDCFILCSSIYRSKKTLSLFEGADSCVEIHDIEKFCNIITRALNRRVEVAFGGIHEVIYKKGRQEEWDKNWFGSDPALIKEKKFQPQGEIRAIWKPKKYNKSIEPLIISDYHLTSHISKVSL